MATFFVSPTGSDAASGLSLDTAFQTLDRAQSAMRTSAGADTTMIRGGTYALAAPLQLTAADSQNTFSSYAVEHPVLSAGSVVSGWTAGSNGIWTAHVNAADVQQFSLNGVQQVEARYPNYDASDPIRGGWLWARDLPSGHDATHEMAYNRGDFTAGQLAPGMKVTVFSELGYSSDVLTIKSVDANAGIVTFVEQANYDLGSASRFFVSDGRVHLDQTGEWWFDQASSTMNYRAPAGFDGSGAVVAGNHSLINVNGAQNVTIHGLTFTDAGRTEATGGIEAGAVVITNGTGIAVDGNQFINDAQGVQIDSGSGNRLVNNDFSHIASSAIRLDPGTANNVISQNSISHSGEVIRTYGAIQMDESFGNTISHNSIRDVPRFGIGELNYDPDNRSGGNTIEYNEILRSGQETPDVGAIYTFSQEDQNHSGDTIRYNRIVDTGGLNTASGHFVAGQDLSSGIYLDDNTNNASVYGNFVQDTAFAGVFVHGGTNTKIYDNVLVDNGQYGIELLGLDRPMTGTQVHDNIVQVSNSGENTLDTDSAFVTPSSIHDNIYYSPTGTQPQIGDLTYARWQVTGGDKGSDVTANPGFVDAQNGNFALTSDSLAAAQGFAPLPFSEMGLTRSATPTTPPGGSSPPPADTSTPPVVEGSPVTDTSGSGQTPPPAPQTIIGTNGNNTLNGSAGADDIHGLAGNDTLRGNGGNDSLQGDTGRDTLYGGAGDDLFVFRAVNESSRSAPDIIADWGNGHDRIDLSGIDANTRVSGDQSFTWIGTAAFSGHAGELHSLRDGQNTIVEGTVNADRVADFQIQISGRPALTALDFLL